MTRQKKELQKKIELAQKLTDMHISVDLHAEETEIKDREMYNETIELIYMNLVNGDFEKVADLIRA